MDRFGSSRLRVVWTLASLLLAGLAMGSIQGFSADGTQVIVFRTPIPLGSDATGIVTEDLGRLIYTLVPAIFVLGGFVGMGEWLSATSAGARLKGLLLGFLLAFVQGLFLSQVALLPILAAAVRLFGAPSSTAGWGRLLQADLNGVLLGVQLLLWSAALGQVLRSNRGLAVLLAYGLAAIGKVLAWMGEWGADLELPGGVVSATAFLGRILPTEGLPSDALAWTSLPFSLGAPLLLAALLLLVSGGKTSKGSARRAKA